MLVDKIIDRLFIDGLNKEAAKRLFNEKHFVDAVTPYGVKAIAFFDKVVVDTWQLEEMSCEKKLYVLLHELCHALRFDKVGKQNFLKKYITENIEELCDFVIYEEILADRYACFMFYRLTGNKFDWSRTQQLNLPENRKKYEGKVFSTMFKKFKNEEEYDDYGKKLYIER